MGGTTMKNAPQDMLTGALVLAALIALLWFRNDMPLPLFVAACGVFVGWCWLIGRAWDQRAENRIRDEARQQQRDAKNQ